MNVILMFESSFRNIRGRICRYATLHGFLDTPNSNTCDDSVGRAMQTIVNIITSEWKLVAII
jgi:hypothetical protein